MTDINFSEKVVVITGAGAGLGRIYAIDFAERGARVVVNDLNKDSVDSVVKEIQENGGSAIANYDSVSSVEGGNNIVNSAINEFGKIDILINNAGIIRDKSLVKMEENDWDDVQNVHLRGAYCVTKPAFLAMRENNYGRIIMTTSGAGLYGNFGQANYSAAKMGLVGFMNVLKIEGAKYNIKINTISPIAATQMTDGVLPPNIFEKMKPEFISPLVLYLSSENVEDSGGIYNCAGGWYSRTQIICSPGTVIDKDKITVEDIAGNWEMINKMEGAKPLSNVAESFGFMASIFS